MPPFDDLLEANARFAAAFPHAALQGAPARHLTILTCMDTRIDDLATFGLAVGDAHILRNAGGRVTDDVIRSLILSSDVLGTRRFAVVHHTNCGVAAGSNDAIRDAIAATRNVDLSAVDFDAFDDVDQSVRDDLARLRASPLLHPDLEIAGFVYDLADGTLRPVDES